MCVFLQVWPGLTAYPDFSNDLTHEWWYDNLKRYHDKVPFDGVWIVSMSGWRRKNPSMCLLVLFCSSTNRGQNLAMAMDTHVARLLVGLISR